MGNLSDFQNKFGVFEYIIYESKYWVWSLRPHQVTIGAGILSLKRECATFSGLEREEFADLDNIVKVIEATLKGIFNYDAINYLMLMMMDKHVHYHVFPRYKNPVKFLGEVWEDGNWPVVPALLGESLSVEKLQEITLSIKTRIYFGG